MEGVGKTTFLQRIKTNSEPDKCPNMTIGIDICSIEDISNSTNIGFWDLGGQERFRSLHSDYMKGMNAIMIMYAVDNRHSFSDINNWLTLIPNSCGSNLFLLGNKVDSTKRIVSVEEAKQWADQHNFQYYEVSAWTGEGIHSFLDIFYHYLSYNDPEQEKLYEQRAECNLV